MSERVDVGPVLADLRALASQLKRALDSPIPAAECTALLKDLHLMGSLALWCRDASLTLAQQAVPRITFREMQELVGIPHTTLYSRHQRWTQERSEQS